LTKGSTPGSIKIRTPSSAIGLLTEPSRHWPQAKIASNPGLSFKVELLSPTRELCEKIRNQSWLLEELCYSTFGMRSCAKGKGAGGKERLITTDPKAKYAKPYLEGRDIKRYSMFPTKRFIRYIPKEMYSPRSPELFEGEKIISQTMLSKPRIVATFDGVGFFVEQSLACIIPHGILTEKQAKANVPLKFILGILNSKLESFFFKSYVIDQSLGGGLIHATPGALDQLLVPKVTKDKIDRLLPLVDLMLSLHEQLVSAKSEEQKDALIRQSDANEAKIDRTIYEFYSLTPDEIAIIEKT
jgi:hypothetical protein